MSEPTHAQLLEVALEAAWRAGRRTLAWFQAGVPVETKANGTPVTPADRESEATLRSVIGTAFPDHGILGEEMGETAGTAPIRWILDPLDATASFIRGVPLYGVLVGVEVRTEPVVGVIHLPALGETIAAARGHGCTWNGRPCRVSSTRSLERAFVVTTSDRACRHRTDRWSELVSRTERLRTWGDCYGYALVATGRADVMVDSAMAAWDAAPMVPILEEAGGLFTDWTGRRTHRGGDGIATNGLLHEPVVALLQS